MSDFKSQSFDRSLPLGQPARTGRRPAAIDWDRINGPPVVPPKGWGERIGAVVIKLLKWAVLLVLGPLVCYAVAGGVGAWLPVNEGFKLAADGVEIFIYSGNTQCDLILPIKTAEKDWSHQLDMKPDRSVSHIAIGWADRALCNGSKAQHDLEIETVIKAMLFPTDAVMHVRCVSKPYTSAQTMGVKISPQQYQQLCEYIEGSFDSDSPLASVSHDDHGQIFPATGKHHLFNTCNNWIGEAMKAGGIKVGRFTPLPKTVFWHLPN